jgi:hypothetical protein
MIEPGTRVIHAQMSDPLVWLGEPHEMRTFTLEIGRGGTGLRASSSSVAPADEVAVPAKSDRVVVEKMATTLHYGPALVWFSYLDGEAVARNKRTRREALSEALRAQAIADWHAAQLEEVGR